MISPMPGCTPIKPGTATTPFFGVDAAILDETGEPCKADEGGRLVIRKPWPGMLRTTPQATAPGATKKETSGSLAAWTTCSTSPATAWALPKWKAPSSPIARWRRPPSLPARTRSRGRLSAPQEIRDHVGKVIGAIAKPDDIYFTPALPKTRSGKIMRRLLKELVATGKATGNMTTLEDITVVENLQKMVNKK